VLLPAVGVALLAFLGWVLYTWYFRPPRLELLAIAVADYRVPDAPPIPYCYEDFQGLRKALGKETSDDSWNDASSSNNEFAQLDSALREASGGHDNLLIYIKAHGVSLNGKAFLLDGRFALREHDGRLAIEDILARVGESPARIKLLVLDTGHIESDPHMGMLTNEFTELVAQAVAKMPPEQNVWVLTSNSLYEQAQVSLKDRRSALGYYLARGLEGAADGVRDGAKPDELVQLDELYQYVREHVTQYARLISSDLQTQTPLLLRAGKGRVSDIPPEVLLRIDEARLAAQKQPEQEAAKKKIAGQMPAANQGNLLRPTAAGVLALALAGNQQAAAADSSEAKSQNTKESAPAEPAKETVKTAGQDTATSAKAAPEKPQPEPATDSKEPADAAKARVDGKSPKQADLNTPPAKPRVRTPIEQSLFDNFTWLENRQQQEELWRPSDYAPDLVRLYYESTCACRQRALAGDLFLNIREYRSSLANKLGETEALERRIDEQRAVFARGEASKSYERDADANAAVRLRNDACYLLPLLVADFHATSAFAQPTTELELEGLIRSTAELDRLIAQEPDQSNTSEWFDKWKRSVRDASSRVRGHFDKLRAEFVAQCAEQKRGVTGDANQAAGPRLVDLAEFPMAAPTEREDLQSLAVKASRSFAEVEKQGSATTRRPNSLELQRLSARGWRRTLDRAALELELAGLFCNESREPQRTKLREAVAKSEALASDDARLALSAQVDKFLGDAYRNMPEQVREAMRSTRYQAWRQAETAVRLADARDYREIGRALSLRTTGPWSSPVADVPLRAVPERVARFQIAIDSDAGSGGEPILLRFKAPSKLDVRFESNEPFAPENVRLKLAYDAGRVQIKNAQGTELAPNRLWPAGVPGASNARELHVELDVASLDEKGKQTELTLSWLDPNDRELSRASVALAHPEPVFSQLAVYGQPGTADQRWRQSQDGKWCFDVPFDNDGLGYARLLTFSGHETAYDFRLTNNATHHKKYIVTIYRIPPPDETNPDRKPAALAESALRRGEQLARNELNLPAGGVESIPFFSASAAPPAAGKEAAPPDAAKANGGKADAEAAKERAPEVSSGLVCVLAEQIASPDAKSAAPGRQQVIVAEVKSQFPSNYITPRVSYDARTGEITAALNVPYVDRLPPGGSKVEIEVITTEPLGRQGATAKRETLLTDQNPSDTLRVFVASASPDPAQVFLHVDGYPRAFIYELPLDASLPNVERRLYELRRIEFPKPDVFPLYRTGTVAQAVPFPIRFDMPPSADRSVFARVFVDQTPGGEFNRLEDREVLKTFDDRVHEARLLKRKDSPGISIQTLVDDFVNAHAPALDLRPYRNQPVNIRAQLVRLTSGREEILSESDGTDRADKTLTLYLDGEAPALVAQGPARPVDENESFRIQLYPRDEVTAVEKVEFATKLERDPDSKDPDAKRLVDPKPVPRQGAGSFSFVYAFEKAGRQSLWFQATDESGNKSEIQEVAVTVLKPQAPTANGAKQAAAPKFGQITGRAALPDGGRGTIKTIVLNDAAGKPIKSIPYSGDGTFVFDRLPPGAYSVSATGFLGGVDSKPNPVSVTVEAGKTAGPIRVELSR
jgi:hypothetical protein